MVWQDSPASSGVRLDAEQERELRLISQARAGADWALAALVARYQPMVVRYLTRLVGDPERARTLAEKVFLRMERRLRGPHGGDYLRLWLLRACTEDGLDALRHPRRGPAPRLDAPGASTRLLAERVGASTQRLREGFGKLAEKTSATGRQVRQLIWATEVDGTPPERAPAANGGPSPTDGDSEEPAEEGLDPRVQLRHRLVRAVLAEIPYGDAQCLALHLVAGLNQAEVAQALGLRPSAARKHIVLGLDVFAQRYESALAELGIPVQLGYGDHEPPTTAAAALAEVADTGTTQPVTIESTAVRVTEPFSAGAAAAGAASSDALEVGALAGSESAAAVNAPDAEPGDRLIAVSARAGDEPAASNAVPVEAEDIAVRTGTAVAGAGPHVDDASKPPILVEPPFWQPTELAEGALSPAASLATSGLAAPALDDPAADAVPVRPEREFAGTAERAGAMTDWPPIGPILETPVVAASPEEIAKDAATADETVLGYESTTVPAAPMAVVPVLSAPDDRPRAALTARERQRVVPVLTHETQASAETEMSTTAPRIPRVVPVRTPDTVEGTRRRG